MKKFKILACLILFPMFVVTLIVFGASDKAGVENEITTTTAPTTTTIITTTATTTTTKQSTTAADNKTTVTAQTVITTTTVPTTTTTKNTQSSSVVGDKPNNIPTNSQYSAEEITLLAKMLYCEAGGTGWDCQVAVCSAMLNHIDAYGGMWVLDNVNHFAPANIYRSKTPLQTQYDVLNYVLSGGRIADIKYFRTDYYHSFGTPVLSVENVYFSK